MISRGEKAQKDIELQRNQFIQSDKTMNKSRKTRVRIATFWDGMMILNKTKSSTNFEN